MFSAGRATQPAAPTEAQAIAWLNVGKSYKAGEDDDDTNEGFTPVAPSRQPTGPIALPKPARRAEEPRALAHKRPIAPPSKVDKLYEIDHGKDKDNLFYGTLNATDVPRYHLFKRKREADDEASLRYFDAKHKVSALSLHLPTERGERATDDDGAPFLALEPYTPIRDEDAELESQRREARVVAQNKHFNAALRQDPSNVDLWLAYMHVQADALGDMKSKAKQRALLLEKQVAIWSRAMLANPTSDALVQLQWFLCMQRSDEADILAELERSVLAHPEHADAWLHLLQRKQMQFGAFSVAALRDLFARMIQSVQMRSASSDVRDATLVHFATLLCRMEAQSGYVERSIGLLQALLELNVSCRSPHAMTEFGAYWEQHGSSWGERGVDAGDVPPLSTTLPSMETFIASVQERSERSLEASQPPLHLRGLPHHQPESSEARGVDAFSDEHFSKHEGDNGQDEGYVWSNIHGHRVHIKDAEDAAEYERILRELRSNQPEVDDVAITKKKAKTSANDVDERLAFDRLQDDNEHASLLLEEDLLMATQWRPLRPNDPADAPLIDEQPDRVLLFDEIQPFLFTVQPRVHMNLFLALVAEVGIRPRYSTPEYMYADALDTDGLENLCDAFFQSDAPAIEPRRMLDSLLHDSIVVARDTLLDPSKLAWARRLLLQGYAQLQRVECLGLALDLETHVGMHLGEHEPARTFAKHVLSAEPSSLLLYERYACMEWRFGNDKMTSRICEKASASAANSLETHRFAYWRVRFELNQADDNVGCLWRCLYLLYAIYDPTVESLARACKRLKKQKAPPSALLTPTMQVRLHQSTQRDVQAALDALGTETQATVSVPITAVCLYHALLVEFVLGGCACELLLTRLRTSVDALDTASRLGRWHNSTTVVDVARQWFLAAGLDLLLRTGASPKQWRVGTHLAVSTVQSQSVFAALFVDAEKKNTMAQQVRRFVQGAVQAAQKQFDAPSPQLWLVALLAELYRAGPSDAACCARHAWGAVAIQRIRKVFEDSLSHASWRSEGCAVLWRLYLRFEVHVGCVDRATKVLYRSIHKCPWSKALYLDAIRVLGPYLPSETHHEILGWLVAKELYLRFEKDS
ncbi:hypothetical protein SDRG_03473 [Saprolegnia diclina VS20]|uniref:Uncharacterized protein n=1 Tax=Saprolegnia diclina (strain VS20) TaxID=1156394 RepID=T0QME0_SAPDV|nr:hypothetical protein SDRG_03473 [Saprolegnia diclina VS20]EQC39269.1 hypothetical protein SDRG_03473 [Saprolegnia diclina VS20]|eukprot:XP_008607330.1 hypothetical protein SDRG_03473 [Saprolegnia diclina VS20]